MDNENTKQFWTLADEALDKLDALQRQRESIDAEIMKMEQFIAAAANMLPDKYKDSVLTRLNLMQEIFRLREVGLTDAVRAILKNSAGQWLTVTDVRDRLVKAGFDFSTYSTNPLASVSTVLRRLPPDEVDRTTVDGGVAAYQWKVETAISKLAAIQRTRAQTGIAPPPPGFGKTLESIFKEGSKRKKD